MLPIMIYQSSTFALINFTGVAARRVGYVAGALFWLGWRSLPKIVAILATIPQSVSGALLMIIMGMLFVEGFGTVLQDGLNRQKALIVGLSLSVGVGFQTQNILADVLGCPWEVAFGSSLVAGVLVAVLLSVVLEFSVSRRRRLEGELDISALPGIEAFLYKPEKARDPRELEDRSLEMAAYWIVDNEITHQDLFNEFAGRIRGSMHVGSRREVFGAWRRHPGN